MFQCAGDAQSIASTAERHFTKSRVIVKFAVLIKAVNSSIHTSFYVGGGLEKVGLNASGRQESEFRQTFWQGGKNKKSGRILDEK